MARTKQKQILKQRLDTAIATMIITEDYPLSMVEQAAFVSFCSQLHPGYKMMTMEALENECRRIYSLEKQLIQDAIEKEVEHVSVTLDTWLSTRNGVGYLFITAFYVDAAWKLQKKLLNIIEVHVDSETAFKNATVNCLANWKIKEKVFSITADKSFSSGTGPTAVDGMRDLLWATNAGIGGRLLIGNCLARCLSNIANVSLRSMEDTIKRIRYVVKYAKFELGMDKFHELKVQLQVKSNEPVLDNITIWKTTYEMLLAAFHSKEIVECFDPEITVIDWESIFQELNWNSVIILCNHLKPLYDTAVLLSTPERLTMNRFFHEVCKLKVHCSELNNSDAIDLGLKHSMREEFDNYWGNCWIVLAIGAAMDPRFKMKEVESQLLNIYGDNYGLYLTTVNDGIRDLFKEYTGEGQVNSELDSYLEDEPLLHPGGNDSFDVLGWWKENGKDKPKLARMARDVLSIPISTVATELVFDTVDKQMDAYRCTLSCDMLQTVFCAKEWIRSKCHG